MLLGFGADANAKSVHVSHAQIVVLPHSDLSHMLQSSIACCKGGAALKFPSRFS